MSTARKNALQLVHYLRFKVNYNDAASGVAVTKQWLPQGAIVLRTDVIVTTGFNPATTNTLSVGFAGGTGTELLNAQSVTATGDTQTVAPAAADPLAADKQVQVTYSQTGAAASAGAAYVVIEYIPDNDLNIGQ